MVALRRRGGWPAELKVQSPCCAASVQALLHTPPHALPASAHLCSPTLLQPDSWSEQPLLNPQTGNFCMPRCEVGLGGARSGGSGHAESALEEGLPASLACHLSLPDMPCPRSPHLTPTQLPPSLSLQEPWYEFKFEGKEGVAQVRGMAGLGWRLGCRGSWAARRQRKTQPADAPPGLPRPLPASDTPLTLLSPCAPRHATHPTTAGGD